MTYARTLFISWLLIVFASFAAWADAPKILLEKNASLSISVIDDGQFFRLQAPVAFLKEIEGIYDDVLTEDINGDGIDEILFQLGTGQVNKCFKVLRYPGAGKSLVEMVFERGEICNFRKEKSYLISSYRDMAIWNEDAYELKSDTVRLVMSDSCVGCGNIQRNIYGVDGTVAQIVVSDEEDFEDRVPITKVVRVLKSKIYTSPDNKGSTKKYLVRGDRVSILGFEGDWVRFRYIGVVTTEGWVRSEDLVE